MSRNTSQRENGVSGIGTSPVSAVVSIGRRNTQLEPDLQDSVEVALLLSFGVFYMKMVGESGRVSAF
jgi:hypothetical protein